MQAVLTFQVRAKSAAMVLGERAAAEEEARTVLGLPHLHLAGMAGLETLTTTALGRSATIRGVEAAAAASITPITPTNPLGQADRVVEAGVVKRQAAGMQNGPLIMEPPTRGVEAAAEQHLEPTQELQVMGDQESSS